MTATVGDRTARDRRRRESSALLCPTCGHATSRAASPRHHAVDRAQRTTLTRELGARKRLNYVGSRGKSERLPPPPPARLIGRNGDHAETAGSVATLVTREYWRSADPSPAAVSILGPAATADEDPVSGNFDEPSQEEMTSREESIRELTMRLEGIEGSCAGVLTFHEPSIQTKFCRDSQGRGASSAVGSGRSEASAAARRLNKDDSSCIWREYSSTHKVGSRRVSEDSRDSRHLDRSTLGGSMRGAEVTSRFASIYCYKRVMCASYKFRLEPIGGSSKDNINVVRAIGGLNPPSGLNGKRNKLAFLKNNAVLDIIKTSLYIYVRVYINILHRVSPSHAC